MGSLSRGNLSMKTRVSVVMGGWSRERHISIQSGQLVAQTLTSLGYHVESIDLTPDLPAFISQLTRAKPDIVFNATHGLFGEDGSLQTLLDSLHIPYTHSPPSPSHIAFHKHLASALMQHHDLPCPHHHAVPPHQLISTLNTLTPPLVIKPSTEGSSLDVHILTTPQHITSFSPPKLLHSYPVWMIENFIPGKELTVAVLNGKALAITEIAHASELYSYEEKYSRDSIHTCPAKLPQHISELILKYAEKTFALLKCQGLARVDFRFNPLLDTKGIFILEINTQPGLTPLSLAPEQAQTIGIDFPSLITRIIS
jgi:D-alanine-D-alanine ligase